MRKRITYFVLTIAALLTIATSFSSCDELIADTLEGSWEGYMYQKFQWDGSTYEPDYTEVTFSKDPYTFSSGTGYWVDYFKNAPWNTDYVGNHTTWTVSNSVIYIHLIEDNVDFTIRNYDLTDNYFTGYLSGSDGSYGDFHLRHTSSPNWNYASYQNWNNYYYYAKTRSGADSVKVNYPVRITR